MKTHSDVYRKIIELTESITLEYLSQNKGGNIDNLKDKIKDFLTNPLWNNDKLIQLINKIKESDFNNEETSKLWKSMEETIDLYHTKHLKSKSHIFEGKIRVYEKRVIEILIDAGKVKGQNAVFGSIIGYLLLHGSLTQNQLKELTGFSKGAISQTLKILSSTPAIRKETLSGIRENIYTFGATMSEIASNISSYKSESNEYAIKFLLSKAQALEEYKDKNGYDILSKRVSDMIKFFEYNIKLLKDINESNFIQELKEDKT